MIEKILTYAAASFALYLMLAFIYCALRLAYIEMTESHDDN